MFLEDGKASFELQMNVENDLEVDANGNFYIVTLIFVEDREEPVEVRILFDQVMENLIDFYRDEPIQNIGYQQMYSIANEFDRHTDKLRETAGYLEGKGIMGDLFDDDPDA